jgi:acyl carrier protein
MELTRTSTVEQVAQVLVATLGIDEPAGGLAADTALFGSMPELDSMAVVEVIVALQEHFGVQIDEEHITGETFETVGSLAALVDARIG